jgi:hypothetical protein
MFENANAIQNKAITLSGTVIYGWKTSEKNMIGAGLARTYRAGQLMHLPVLFWNKTFNDKWGMELLLPARGFVRYNFSTTSMLQAGFELEGNEAVINRQSSLNYMGLLDQINQSGGGKPIFNNFDDSRIVEAIYKQRSEPIRAYVVESDITNKQQVTRRLEQLAQF